MLQIRAQQNPGTDAETDDYQDRSNYHLPFLLLPSRVTRMLSSYGLCLLVNSFSLHDDIQQHTDAVTKANQANQQDASQPPPTTVNIPSGIETRKSEEDRTHDQKALFDSVWVHVPHLLSVSLAAAIRLHVPQKALARRAHIGNANQFCAPNFGSPLPRMSAALAPEYLNRFFCDRHSKSIMRLRPK
jgi:hypothetical protein